MRGHWQIRGSNVEYNLVSRIYIENMYDNVNTYIVESLLDKITICVVGQLLLFVESSEEFFMQSVAVGICPGVSIGHRLGAISLPASPCFLSCAITILLLGTKCGADLTYPLLALSADNADNF